MKFPVKIATRLFREEVTLSELTSISVEWENHIERLSALCAEGISSTHIAFLGTAILAKSLNAGVDLFAIKPEHAVDNINAYSARTLCHSVLVPLAAELGINIGVTGREPLNNQPYFRIVRLGDGTPVHKGGRAAFSYMLELIDQLHKMRSEAEARECLRAFVVVRRRYQPKYALGEGDLTVTSKTLALNITRLVASNSERGRRAQAVVAGLFDVFAGPDRVESGRINDPSRKYPGDVCVRSADDLTWEKSIEVRDKPVKMSDVQIFCKKCAAMNVREAAVVMVALNQVQLDIETLTTWAAAIGVGITLFYGWSDLVEQVLFWAPISKPRAASASVEAIERRLIAVESSPEAVEMWQSLVRA